MKTYSLLSGGVDSSVAAYDLLDSGHEVTGVHLVCWSEEELIRLGLDPAHYPCTSAEDEYYARMTAEQLTIPYQLIDLRKTYFDFVIKKTLQDYKKGLTPNPDILCNSIVKYQAALEFFEPLSYIASGHYARIYKHKEFGTLIARAKNREKDQSYFLSAIQPEVLSRILFPIGEYITKNEVRSRAEKVGLYTAHKNDSQGICFVGDIPMRKLLLSLFGAQSGPIKTYDGTLVGEHKGAYQFTIGQRHGLGMSGGPWYVSSIDIENNIVYVTQDVSKIDSTRLRAHVSEWYCNGSDIDSRIVQAQVRYRQPAQEAYIRLENNSSFTLEFKHPVRAIAPGQSVVLYLDDCIIGSGVIQESI